MISLLYKHSVIFEGCKFRAKKQRILFENNGKIVPQYFEDIYLRHFYDISERIQYNLKIVKTEICDMNNLRKI